MKSVSVIMPVYNVSNYLYKSINSINKQTLDNIEIICVNDGSTDDSLEILNELQQKQDNITIISQKNSGPGIARNTGIKNATGEYIAFLDADDIFLDNTALEKMYTAAKKHETNLVCANLKWITQDYFIAEYYDYLNSRFTYFSKEGCYKPEEYGIPFGFYKNIFNKDFIIKNEITFPNLKSGEDPIFMANVLAKIEDFYALSLDLYGYNHSVGGGVNEKINTYDRKEAYINHFKEVFDILTEKKITSIFEGYKIEFVDYLIYSDNLHDTDIKNIIKENFEDYEKYFKPDDFGYFILKYIINYDESKKTPEIDEYAFIKKCLFEESCITPNSINPQILRKYVEYSSRLDADKEELKKFSFNELLKIHENISKREEYLSEKIELFDDEISKKYYDKNAEFLKKFIESRIDIKNYGNSTNDIVLLNTDTKLYKKTKPEWFKNQEGQGSVITSVNGSIDLTMKCVNDGNLVIEFKGRDFHDKTHNRIPIYVDYTKIIIDDEEIINESTIAWHDRPYVFEKKVTDGQIINIKLKWRPLNYQSNIQLLSDYEKILKTYSQCRVDIKNFGKKNNEVLLLDCDDPYCEILQPKWFKNEEGQGSVIKSTNGTLNMSFKCINDGRLSFNFKGIDYNDFDNDKIPIFIEYTSINVDGIDIIDKSIVTWHDDPFIFEKYVKDGQIVNINFSWKPLTAQSNVELISESNKLLDIFNRCRIDLKNVGNKNNKLEVLNCNDSSSKIVQPDWFKHEDGMGSVLTSSNGELDLTMKCVNDGELLIKFRGVDFKNKNRERLPIYIDFTEIIIDDEKIIPENHLVWHDQPIIFRKKVKNEQTVRIQAKWLPLNSSSDIKIIPNQKEIDNLNNKLNIKISEINELEKEINLLENENQKLENFNKDILQSNSWKITEPLRKLKNN